MEKINQLNYSTSITNPLISVIIPAYNVEKYIFETILALKNQSYQNIEIIIIDDGSFDDTSNIIKKFKDSRITYFKIRNSGAAKARNIGFERCKGEYLIFMDADDWVPENFIKTQLQLIKSELSIVVSNWGRFYNNDLSTFQSDPNQICTDLTFYQWILNYWYTNQHMTCPGRVFFSRGLIEKADMWNESLTLNDDFAFFVSLFAKCDIIRYNKQTSFFYRSGIKGLSSKKSHQDYLSLYNSICLGISIALKLFKNDTDVNKACANLLQYFIYEAYPDCKMQILKATSDIKHLGGSDFSFQAGGKTKWLLNLLGWKTTKIINTLLKQIKLNIMSQYL